MLACSKHACVPITCILTLRACRVSVCMCKCQCRSVSVCSATVVEVSVCKCKCRSVSVQRVFRKNPSQCFREKQTSFTLEAIASRLEAIAVKDQAGVELVKRTLAHERPDFGQTCPQTSHCHESVRLVPRGVRLFTPCSSNQVQHDSFGRVQRSEWRGVDMFFQSALCLGLLAH